MDESATVVPIPVLEKQLSEEPPALADVTNADTRDVPAISVTKPPAPQPVNLPSANDVVPLPSPPDSNRSSVDVDLEAGRGVRRPVNAGIIASKPTATPPDAVLFNNDISPAEQSPTGEEDTDLLPDAAPLEAVLSSSSSIELELEPVSQTVVDVAEPSTSLSPPEEDVPTDSTIRLVNGGSSSGVDSTPFDDAVSDIPVVAVADSSEPSPKKEETHDRAKSSSLSSFKRLGVHFTSGKRKKDSVTGNSVKETL